MESAGCFPDGSLRSFNLAGSKAGSANVHFLGSAVYLHANRLDIGLPNMIGASMGMANIVSKMNAFSANSTFRHGSTSFTSTAAASAATKAI